MKTFDVLGLNPEILHAVQQMGFTTPTPVQAAAIPVLLESETDLVALAQTGTGKTAAFGLPMLNLIHPEIKKPQGLILCPTRELCIQISKDLMQFSSQMAGVKVVAVYGGAAIEPQMKALQEARIIVATPGRMVDIIQRDKVNLQNIAIAVLDEADEMLNMGFKEDLDFILSYTPETKKTWLFSATMPQEVARIAKHYMHAPHEITIGEKNSGNENISHVFYEVSHRDRYSALKRIADASPDIFAIVFCRTRRETQAVADALIKDGYAADSLHGELSQSQRDQVMKRYRGRMLKMLVATDVAARGIDVQDVTHVINYNLPDELENYTHRSGRTARAGKKGISITMVTKSERGKIKQLEKILRTTFVQGKVPAASEVMATRLRAYAQDLLMVKPNPELETYLKDFSQAMESIDREDLLRILLAKEFSTILDYYSKPGPQIQEEENTSRRENEGVGRFFINLGTMDGFNTKNLAKFLSQTAGIKTSDVLWSGIKSSYTLLEINPDVAEQVATAFEDCYFGDRQVRIEVRNGRSGGAANKFKSTKKESGKSFKSTKPAKKRYGANA
jgi:ATP-dependent RNA helicase DeaD